MCCASADGEDMGVRAGAELSRAVGKETPTCRNKSYSHGVKLASTLSFFEESAAEHLVEESGGQ